MKRFLLLAWTLTGLATGLFCAHVAWCVRSEHAYRARLAELEAAGHLPVPETSAPSATPEAHAVRRRLWTAGRALEQHLPAQLHPGRVEDAWSADWPEEREAELAGWIDELGPWFRALDELFADPATARVLERAERIGEDRARPSQLTHAAKLLCIRARLDAARPGGDAAAARHLARAIDLVRLQEDHSMLGLLIRGAADEMALVTAARLCATGVADPALLRAELEPRLDRGFEAERLVEAMRLDLEIFAVFDPTFTHAYSRFEAWRAHPRAVNALLTSLRPFEVSVEIARSTPEGFRDARTAAPEGLYRRNVVGTSWVTGIQQLQRTRAVERLAVLALAAWEHERETGALPKSLAELEPRFAGEPPLDPLTGEPFRWAYEETRDGPVLRLGPIAWVEEFERGSWQLTQGRAVFEAGDVESWELRTPGL